MVGTTQRSDVIPAEDVESISTSVGRQPRDAMAST